MILAVALALYAVAILVLGPPVITRCGWTERSPHVGIVVWQVWAAAIGLSALGAALAVVVQTLPEGGLRWLVLLCLRLLRVPGSAVAPTVLALLALLAAAGLLMRLAITTVVLGRRVRRQRQAHRLGLAMVGRPWQDRTVLVEHPSPLAYCLPGRHCQVVVSTGARAQLTAAEFDAVLAHERAHLAGRHHLVLFTAQVFVQAFPLPCLRTARAEIGVLVEMLADDVASRHHGAPVLAAALATLATQPLPLPERALGAAHLAVGRRFDRLVAPRAKLSRVTQLGAAAALLTVVGIPVLVSGAAVSAAALTPPVYCPTRPSTALTRHVEVPAETGLWLVK